MRDLQITNAGVPSHSLQKRFTKASCMDASCLCAWSGQITTMVLRGEWLSAIFTPSTPRSAN